MKYLLVAEKDSVKRQIEDVYEKHRGEIVDQLGGEIDCIALSGHVCTWFEPCDYPQWHDVHWNQMDGMLPLVPEKFLIKPVKGDHAAEKLESWKEAVDSGKYSGYINACDSDSEGNLIFYRAAKYLGVDDKPTMRFFETSLTEKEILNSLLHMENFYTNDRDRRMLDQSMVRSKFDWETGMNCTIAVSNRSNETMHIGRVKAPTINLVYKNDKEISEFVKKVTYQVQVKYEDGFNGTLCDSEGQEIEFETPEEASQVIDSFGDEYEAPVKEIRREIKKTSPGQLYKLSTIQVEAGKKYNYTPSETLATIQKLYEGKYLTYPRCDSQYVSPERALEFPELLDTAACVPELSSIVENITEEDVERVKSDKRVVNEKKVKEASHDALLITSNEPDFEKLSEDEKNIYTMVAKRFVAQFLPKLEEEKTVLITEFCGRHFKSTGSVVKKEGWTVLYDKETKAQEIPAEITEEDVLWVDGYIRHPKETKPKDRYTEASLIADMESIAKYIPDEKLRKSLRAGIGTQATRAAIISEIIKDGYVRSEGKTNKLFITDKGKEYIRKLEWSSIIEPQNAALWETVFQDVREGRKSPGDAMVECMQYVNEFIDEVDKKCPLTPKFKTVEGLKCPYCGGKIYEKKYSYQCENAGEGGCLFQVNRCEGKLTENDLKELIEKGHTKPIKDVCYSKSKDKYYTAALKLLPKGSDKVYVFDFEPTVTDADAKLLESLACPYCGKKIKSRKFSYVCEGFENNRECEFSVIKSNGKVSVKDLKDLITNKKTRIIKKVCYSKEKDKYYDACLELQPKGSGRTIKYGFPGKDEKK